MTSARLQQLLAAFPAQRILVVGDLMLDEFVWGGVKRISPEAPVPVVDFIREESYPGGAANVARNLCEFTRSVSIMGVIGCDSGGEKLTGLLREGGMDLSCVIESPGHQTAVKTRILARQQQVCRVDRERRLGLDEAQTADVLARLRDALPALDAVIIEDYGKGLLTQRFADQIIALALAAGKIITVDPNPGNPLDWRGVHTIKPNRSEAFASAGLPASDPVDPVEADTAVYAVGRALLEKWDAQNLLLTLSEQGMLLFQKDAQPYHTPPRARQVFDLSGAGDTSIALYTLALCAGASPIEAAEIANHAGGVVVGKLGTATLTPAELVESFAR